MTAPQPTLFIDRDGTLIEEPPDNQVDSFEKLRFVPGVIPALMRLRDAGFRFVMVTNQNGLGTLTFPEENFRGPHGLLLQLLESQGVPFDDALVCPHHADDGCTCRKPGTALVDSYSQNKPFQRERSAVIGDRTTDLQLAERLGIRGFRIVTSDPDAWGTIANELTAHRPRRARAERATRETRVEVRVDLDRDRPVTIQSGIGIFDHMLEQVALHGGFSLALRCEGDLQVDEHHSVEDCALTLGQALREALGDRRGIGRYGFVLPMDEARVSVVLDLSGRPYARFDGKFDRDRVGSLPTELVPHFFRSLGDALGAAIHVEIRGENTHHMVEACFKGLGRALRQAVRIEGGAMPSSKGTL